jgi:flagellar hook-associated protein 2
MSTVSSVNSSTTSSLYGTRNVISGLASGMDTETMIQNAVSGYQTKITNLQAQRTKYEWKQESYRDIISNLVNFSQKYTSYTSSTNLLSASFFNNATKVTTSGANASKASATGRSSSEIQLTSVSKLATAARATVAAAGSSDGMTSAAGESFQLTGASGQAQLSTLQGTLTLGYGGTTVSLSFDESDIFQTTTAADGTVTTAAQAMADAINKKLEDETISYNSGNQAKASTVIRAVADGDTIRLEEIGSGGNGVWIDSASGDLKSGLGITTGKSSQTFQVSSSKAYYETKSNLEYISDKGFTITLDGTTKTVKGPTQEEIDAAKADDSSLNDQDAFIKVLQDKINKEFGELENADGTTRAKLTVTNANGAGADSISLQFKSDSDTSSFQVTSEAGKAAGIEGSLANYTDTTNTLSQILGENALTTNAKGEKVYQITIGDKTLEFDPDTTLSNAMTEINGDDDIDVKINYSQITKEFTFTSKETGEAGNKTIAMDSNARALFGTSDDLKLSGGGDAKFSVTVNGTQKTLTRSSNIVDIDGLSVTLKGTFNVRENPDDTDFTDLEKLDSDNFVTFNVSADADTIVNAIKSMVADYNTMASAIKTAYSTLPLQKSDGSSYEPLSDDDMADMSDSAIERYETNAKTGLLFGDSDLSSCYSGLVNAISSSTAASKIFSQIGLSTSYSDGMTTLTLNETKLREALESDPDKVRDAFAGSSGIMQGLSTVVDRYASTTGATKGILIQKAGSTLAPTSIYSNTWQSAMDDIDDEIDKWQDKLSDKIDYYTTQFTNLETLISQLNSQSSMLSSLMGG